MTISGASGSAGTLTLSVKGTAGKKVKVTLYTMDETELGNQDDYAGGWERKRPVYRSFCRHICRRRSVL